MTRSQDVRVETERKILLANLTTEWQVGYIDTSLNPMRREYTYAFKCMKCNDTLVNSDSEVLIHVTIAHVNKCWDDKIKEMYRKDATRIVAKEPYLILEKKEEHKVDYLCNWVVGQNEPCEQVSPTPEMALLHWLTHNWPDNDSQSLTTLRPLTEFTDVPIWDVLTTGVMCHNCITHVSNQMSFLRHLPCPYDEMALELGHDEISERLWFVCTECRDLSPTLDELTVHTQECPLGMCISCLRVMDRDMINSHPCFQYVCEHCKHGMMGTTTYKHKCTKGLGKSSSYSKQRVLDDISEVGEGGADKHVTFAEGEAQQMGGNTPDSSQPGSDQSDPKLDETASTASPPASARKQTVDQSDVSQLAVPTLPPTPFVPSSNPAGADTGGQPMQSHRPAPPIPATRASLPAAPSPPALPPKLPPRGIGNVNAVNPVTSTPKSRLHSKYVDPRSGLGPAGAKRLLLPSQQTATTSYQFTAPAAGSSHQFVVPTVAPTHSAQTASTTVPYPGYTSHQISPGIHMSGLPMQTGHATSTGSGAQGTTSGSSGSSSIWNASTIPVIGSSGSVPSQSTPSTGRSGGVTPNPSYGAGNPFVSSPPGGGGMQVGGGGGPPPNPDPEYRCRYCFVKFATLQDLAQHEVECIYNPANQGKPLKCPICYLVVTGADELERHINSVHGWHEMVCSVCNRNVYRDVSDYLTHIASHADTLSEAFQQIQRAQNASHSLYSTDTAQAGTYSGGTPSQSYTCKLCFMQVSRDDLFFEHYSMNKCPGLMGMSGDINARASPLNPPRRFNRDSYHDRKKLAALCCLQEVSLMNKAILVDVLTAITYQQTVTMPVFGAHSTKPVKETEVNTIKELRLNTQDPIDCALCMEDFLQRLVSFVETIQMSEETALKILKRKVGSNLLYTLEQFLMKWNTVAIGPVPFFIPCSFLEVTYMCAASPRLAKIQLAEMKMLPTEGPTELLNRITRLASLATKELPHDLRCHQAEELSFNAFLRAIPPKCKRILMNEQTLREKLSQEPLGATGALQLIQKRLSHDTVLIPGKEMALYANLGFSPKGQNRPQNPAPKVAGPKGGGKKRGKQKPNDWYAVPAVFPQNAPKGPPNAQAPAPARQNKKDNGKKATTAAELVARAKVKTGECVKCGGNNHHQNDCRTFPGPLPPHRCKFHGRYLHWGAECPLNPKASDEIKKRKCFAVIADTAEAGEDVPQITEDETETPSAEFAGLTLTQGSNSTTLSVMSAYQQWANSMDDD